MLEDEHGMCIFASVYVYMEHMNTHNIYVEDHPKVSMENDHSVLMYMST
jgi:hypothetical protein